MEILPFLLAPFVASLILTGIHAYLGVHVVERGVIFVDLALAQIAALGATVAIVIGMGPHGRGSYWISLAFTFLGAAIFAFARTRRGHIPQEAFIGIAYAVASAGAILLMSKATGETEHLKDMLVGNILAVSWQEVRKTAILYGAIGIFHYIFRKKFLMISMNHEKAQQLGIKVRFLRIRRDFFGRYCRRPVGLLLSHCSQRRRHAFCRSHRPPACHWLDHGHFGLGAWLFAQRST
jgi:zinc/manganese transport system permease protein